MPKTKRKNTNSAMVTTIRIKAMYFAIYGMNLGDKFYAQNNICVDGQAGNLAFWGAPRTFGGTFFAVSERRKW
jgi:hypothetical protein